ncbi:2638_t:CDS:2 [Entrophospora sp. SA101]|nr:2638_t:CDS:2 [Entrophospora sp. SA101]
MPAKVHQARQRKRQLRFMMGYFRRAQVKKLQREKELLRLFLHELVEAHYRTINQEPEAQEPEPKKEETC